MRNCAPCHLPNVNGQMDSSLIVVLNGLRCMLCGQVSKATTMLICDKFSQGWHMGCLMPPMEEMPNGKWQMVLPSVHLIDLGSQGHII